MDFNALNKIQIQELKKSCQNCQTLIPIEEPAFNVLQSVVEKIDLYTIELYGKIF